MGFFKCALGEDFSAHFAFNILKTERTTSTKVEQRATTQGKKQALLSLRFSFAIHRSLARACVFHYFTKLCHAVFHGHSISRKNTEEEARGNILKSFYTFNQRFLRFLFEPFAFLPPFIWQH